MRITSPRQVGLLVREQRKSLGLTQHDLAERVGASRQWVQNLEAGKPGLEIGLTLRALAALRILIDARPLVDDPRSGAELPAIHAESIVAVQIGNGSLIDRVIAEHRSRAPGKTPG